MPPVVAATTSTTTATTSRDTYRTSMSAMEYGALEEEASLFIPPPPMPLCRGGDVLPGRKLPPRPNYIASAHRDTRRVDATPSSKPIVETNKQPMATGVNVKKWRELQEAKSSSTHSSHSSTRSSEKSNSSTAGASSKGRMGASSKTMQQKNHRGASKANPRVSHSSSSSSSNTSSTQKENKSRRKIASNKGTSSSSSSGRSSKPRDRAEESDASSPRSTTENRRISPPSTPSHHNNKLPAINTAIENPPPSTNPNAASAMASRMLDESVLQLRNNTKTARVVSSDDISRFRKDLQRVRHGVAALDVHTGHHESESHGSTREVPSSKRIATPRMPKSATPRASNKSNTSSKPVTQKPLSSTTTARKCLKPFDDTYKFPQSFSEQTSVREGPSQTTASVVGNNKAASTYLLRRADSVSTFQSLDGLGSAHAMMSRHNNHHNKSKKQQDSSSPEQRRHNRRESMELKLNELKRRTMTNQQKSARTDEGSALSFLSCKSPSCGSMDHVVVPWGQESSSLSLTSSTSSSSSLCSPQHDNSGSGSNSSRRGPRHRSEIEAHGDMRLLRSRLRELKRDDDNTNNNKEYGEAHRVVMTDNSILDEAPVRKQRVKKNVRFSDPLVSRIKYRPFTPQSDIPLLFFQEEELEELEWDRENTIPDQFECEYVDNELTVSFRDLYVQDM